MIRKVREIKKDEIIIAYQPIGEHLLNNGLSSSQHQLRVLRRQTLLHQLQQQRSGDSKLSSDGF